MNDIDRLLESFKQSKTEKNKIINGQRFLLIGLLGIAIAENKPSWISEKNTQWNITLKFTIQEPSLTGKL